MNEGTPPNSIVAVLGDEQTRKQVYYQFIEGNEDRKFAINKETFVLLIFYFYSTFYKK